MACLQAIELVPPPRPQPLGTRVRIAAWNAERCKYLPESAALLDGIGADIVLLTELDIGMARSGNRHTVRELARTMGVGYAFGVEYVELGLGDDREKAWHANESNAVGLHGNAILSKAPLDRPAVVRLDDGARWFAGEQSTNERRIGARMAMIASLDAGGTPLLVAAVHLESSTDAADRAAQVAVLLQAIERRADGHAVIIGGDFNTSALPPAETDDGAWFEDAASHEAMFAQFQRGRLRLAHRQHAVCDGADAAGWHAAAAVPQDRLVFHARRSGAARRHGARHRCHRVGYFRPRRDRRRHLTVARASAGDLTEWSLVCHKPDRISI